MSVAHTFEKKIRTADVLITESVDFAGLLLSKNVLEGLLQAGFKKPSPIQLKAIPLGRCGLDLIVQAKSGTGKTCVFTVVALEGVDTNFVGIQVLVLAPTREIAQQIQDVVKTIGKTLVGLKCKTFIGGLPLSLDKVSAKKCHIAVGTPGRVKQLIEIGAMDTTSIRLFVLDEADKLLEGDFQESINWIYSTLPENKQMLALSATYPDYLAQHLTAYMRNPTFVRLNATDPALLGIKQFYVSVPSHPMPNVIFNSKTLAVVKLISNINFQQCLIFSNMQTRAKNLQSELQSRNWPTACIAGCLDQKERTFAMDQLKTYKCRILISTDLTSRGIDADKVNLVINMDIPSDHETYLHRIGRAGRFGSHGAAVTIITSDGEINEMKDIEKKCNTTIKELPEPIPRDLIIKPEVVSLDDVVTSEQIINKPEIIQNEIEKKDVSLLHTTQHSDPPTHVLKDELLVCDNIVTDVLSLTRVIVHENSVNVNNREKFSKTDCEADISTCAKENYFLNEVELPEPKTVNNECTEKQVFQVEREKIIHEMSDKNILEKEWLKTNRTVSSISSDELLKKMLNHSDVIITSEFNDVILLSDISEDKTIEKENYLYEEKHSEASLGSVPELHEDKLNVLNTEHSQLKGRLTEDDLPSGSDSNSPSYAPQREIARSRQRRRAPRSLAVCDFLHYVKDDFVGVKDTGAGGDNLEGKCFTTIASDVDNSHSAANLKNKDEDQSQQYERETGGQSGSIKHDCRGVESMKILEPGQLGSAASNVYSSDRKQPCSQDDVKELGINEDSVVCDGELTDCQFKNDAAVVMNLKLATHTLSDSNQDGVIQSGTSCILSNGTEFSTTSTHFMNHISASQTAESIPENGHISSLSSNSGKNLSDVLSNVSTVASVPDLNSITRALSFLLTQTEKVIQPVSFTKLVGDHTHFCDQFDKTSSKDPVSTQLSESLELKDVINWQVVCESNSMKLDHFKSNINDRLQFLEMERLLNKERMADRDSGDKKFNSIVEINDAKDSEKTSTKQVKKTGKSKKKKKSPKPSDNLDWRSAQLDNVEQRIGKEFLTNQINTDNGYQVPEENHRVGLTLYLTPVQKSKVEFQTSCENTEKFNSLTRYLESESSNTEERVSRHQKSRSKDDECQALDDMHNLMLKRRQERKRLRQQSSESASAILIQDKRLDSANCTFQVKNDPIGEPQNDSNLKSAGVCRTKGLVPHKTDAESSIISVLSDKDNVDKHAADSKKDSGSLWKKKDIIVGIDKKVKKSASVAYTKVKLETAVSDHSQRLHSEDSLHENKKLIDRNPDRNPECMVTNVGKYKPRKPSKTRARLAGLEISDGSTSSSSSSSHLSLSSTSDMSDVLSDVDSEHQILKFQCYANRYADDERCMLYDSTRSDGYPLHVAHGLCKHQNTESSPYSTDEAYHRNFCISSYSPYVPSCLPASAVHLQLPSSKIEHSVGNEYSKVVHKSKQDPSHLKNNKLSGCLHRNVTGGMKLKNDKKASHDSVHHHPNSTFAKKGKSGSFEQYPSSEYDSDSDHPSESKCSSNQSFSEYHQYFLHHPSFCGMSPAFIPVTSCNRFMHPHPPPSSSYFTYQQQMASPYFFPHPLQYFPQNLTYWSYQWYLQYQYINCMTKAYTYYFEK
ncbi:hypothetical protein Btru_020233 [Bulinus truncatus]|nr:hypothetical protein Btru_020233 [Bulinus truncatus]